jgi:hypothetical protein
MLARSFAREEGPGCCAEREKNPNGLGFRLGKIENGLKSLILETSLGRRRTLVLVLPFVLVSKLFER